MRRRRWLPGLFAAVVLWAPAGAQAATPIHFSSAGITPGSEPAAITPGPGGVWFTERGNRVARIDETGAVTEFSAGIHGAPGDITAGADGNVWFTEAAEGRVARITPQGAVTEFSAGITGFPARIASGSDGNVWFTEFAAGKVAKIQPDGTVTEYDDAGGGAPDLSAPGPDGRMWFTASGVLGAITPNGEVTDSTFPYEPEFAEDLAPGPGDDMALSVSNPDPGPDPPDHVLLFSDLDTLEASIPLSDQAIAMARDPAGDLWVPEDDDRIMRISADGSHAEFRSDASQAEPIVGIAAGPDGRMWVTQPATDRIGVFDPKVALPPPDTTGPSISVTTPAAGAHYAQGAHVEIGFSCADSESAVTFCQGEDAPVQVSCADWPALSRIPHAQLLFLDRPGDALDTAQPGAHRFSVASIGYAGQTGCVTRTYVVDPAAPGPPDRSTLRARLRRVGGAITRALKRGGERRLARRHVIGLKVHWPSAGRLTVVVRRMAHGSRRLTSAKTAHLTLHTTKRGRKAARASRRHHHRLRLKLGLRFKPSGQAAMTRRASVTLKR